MAIHSEADFQENLLSVLSKDEVRGATFSTDSKARDRPIEEEDGTNGI